MKGTEKKRDSVNNWITVFGSSDTGLEIYRGMPDKDKWAKRILTESISFLISDDIEVCPVVNLTDDIQDFDLYLILCLLATKGGSMSIKNLTKSLE